MSAIDELVENAKRHQERYSGGGLGPEPRRKIAVIACMDARLDPLAILGLSPGEAHVLRNAGGIVTDDVIRSLAISQRLLGTDEVMLVHHTGCGMLGLADEEFRRELERDVGVAPSWDAGGFADVDGDVRTSIARIRESPFMRAADVVRGFVYEVETGRLREVA